MNVYTNYTIMLPVEIYPLIAAESVEAYRAMLAVPPFARTIDVSTKYDYMVHFGYYVMVTPVNITWFLNGVVHRVDGPAIDAIMGEWYSVWYYKGKLHRNGGPAIEYPDGNYERRAQKNQKYNIDTPPREEQETWWHHGDVLHANNHTYWGPPANPSPDSRMN